jgi:hypothetical protein
VASHRILRLVTVAAVALAVAIAAGCSTAGPSSPPAPDRAPVARRTAPQPTSRSPAPAPLRLLHAWDARRGRAYATGSVSMLRRLYLPRCAAARADVRMLRAYAGRGYRVRGLRMQVLRVEVLAHAPGRWRLRVTDRVARAVAVGHGSRVLLPRDRASTRVVDLVRAAGRWRVASVRPADG